MVSEVAIREPPGGWAPPWPQARELALAAPNEWILIGGLMVALHSRIAGREPSRTTHDLDALLDLTCTNMQRADGALRGLGYTFAASIDDAAPAHRWVRERDRAVVDVLVPDHQPRPPRFARRGTVAVPGATSVLARHVERVTVVGEVPIALRIPTLPGAVVLKSGAYLADSRDRDRHLDDLAELLSCAPDYRRILQELGLGDRRRLRAALPNLAAHLRHDSRHQRVAALLPLIGNALGLEPPLTF